LEKKNGASVAERSAPFFAPLRKYGALDGGKRFVWRAKSPSTSVLNVKNVAAGAVERVQWGSVADFTGV